MGLNTKESVQGDHAHDWREHLGGGNIFCPGGSIFQSDKLRSTELGAAAWVIPRPAKTVHANPAAVAAAAAWVMEWCKKVSFGQ